MGKFIRNALPRLLSKMKRKHGWSDLPRTIVHDKAGYFVSPLHNRLQMDFGTALKQSGFRSWVGDTSDSAAWLVKKFWRCVSA